MNYHERLQNELNKRQPAKVLVGLSASELLAISRKPLPVFNIKTGERV